MTARSPHGHMTDDDAMKRMDESRENGDIFDRLMGLPVLRVFEPFYRRHKAVLLYLFFGGLTFFLSVAVFVLFESWLLMNEHSANVLSWIIAVLFAYLTNRTWVFAGRASGKGCAQRFRIKERI